MEIAWKNLALLAWLTLGNTALWVAMINRAHALNLPESLLRHSRHVHDFVLVAFPVALLGMAGSTAAPWSEAESWHRLPVAVLAYIAVCNVTACAAVCVMLLRWRKRPIEQQISNHSTTRDIAQELGHRPLGKGPYHLLAHVPRNEILHVQVSEKQLVLPRLPVDWDELRLLHLSDLHFIGCPDLPYYERVVDIARDLQPDMVVLTGDLLDRQHLQRWLPPTLGRIEAPLGCYFILGNHDHHFTDPPQTRNALECLGWCDVAGRTATVSHDGHELVIGGTEMPWMGEHPNFSSAPPESFRLLLSHTPDNFAWAGSKGIDLMLAGHNHGGQVRLPGFGPVFSPSLYGCRYASGTFWDEPTLLHVSRGIGAKHPLRLNCPPELPLLILRSQMKLPVVGCQLSELQPLACG